MPDQADASLEPVYLAASRAAARTRIGGVLVILIVMATIAISAASGQSSKWHLAPAPMSAGHRANSQSATLPAAR
jgi:hypothetical protein